MTPSRVESVLSEIEQLAPEFTPWGSLRPAVLRALARHAEGMKIDHSVETGTGKSTLLISQLSSHHQVFTLAAFDQMGNVQGSSLLNRNSVEFIEGPTQKTLPVHRFESRVQLAFLDGPHAYPFPELEYYFIYPHLDPGALLVVDDIQIPTVNHLFRFLCEDRMFQLLEVVETTAFFRRTDAPTFDPYGDSWEEQGFNSRHHPAGVGVPLVRRLKNLAYEKLPQAIKNRGRVHPR